MVSTAASMVWCPGPIGVRIGPEGALVVFGHQQSRLVGLGTAEDQPIVTQGPATGLAAEDVPSRRPLDLFPCPAARVSQSRLNSPVMSPRGAGICSSAVDHSAFPAMRTGPRLEIAISQPIARAQGNTDAAFKATSTTSAQ